MVVTKGVAPILSANQAPVLAFTPRDDLEKDAALPLSYEPIRTMVGPRGLEPRTNDLKCRVAPAEGVAPTSFSFKGCRNELLYYTGMKVAGADRFALSSYGFRDRCNDYYTKPQ